eukprot:5792428-Pyramimonas_sp.AAC.1
MDIRNARPITDDCTSLVKLITDDGVEEVLFVAWTDFARRLGGKQSLDKNNKPITIIGFAVPVKDYSNSLIIIGDAPVVRGKFKKHERPDVPEWCLTIKELESIRIWPGPAEDDGPCVQCATRTDDPMYKCTECLSAWH